MEPTLFVGLGILAVGAMSLSNAASVGLHTLERTRASSRGRTGGADVFRSGDASELMNAFRSFPTIVAWSFFSTVTFVFLVGLHSFWVRAGDQSHALFVVIAFVTYTGIIVWRLVKISQELFRVMQRFCRVT